MSSTIENNEPTGAGVSIYAPIEFDVLDTAGTASLPSAVVITVNDVVVFTDGEAANDYAVDVDDIDDGKHYTVTPPNGAWDHVANIEIDVEGVNVTIPFFPGEDDEEFTTETPYSHTPEWTNPDAVATVFSVVGSLPDGLTLDPDTGEVSGEFEDDGSYTITIRATTELGTDDVAWDVEVTPLIDPALMWHIDASVASSLTLAGSTVEQWRDIGNSGVHLNRTDGSPTLQSAIQNGLDGVLINDNVVAPRDIMLGTGTIHSTNVDVTIFFVYRFVNDNNGQVVLTSHLGGFGTGIRIIGLGGNGNVRMEVGGDTSVVLAAGGPLTACRALAFRRKADGTYKAWRGDNGATVTGSGNTVQVAITNPKLDNAGGGAASYDVRIFEVQVWSEAKTDQEVTDILAALVTKWGAT